MAKRATVKKRSGKEKPQESTEPQDENAKDDDRNLVVVDDDFEEADFDEKVWLFWDKNKGNVYMFLIVVLGALAAYLGMKKMKRAEVESLQAAYLESLEGNADDFIAKHGDTALGGLAIIAQADEKFKVEEYAAAAEKYKAAADSLKGTLLGPRAQMGYGISSIYNNDAEGGKSAIKAILDDPVALESQKAEALYHLGVLEVEQKNFEAAKAHFKELEDNEKAGSWMSKVELLRRNYSELEVVEPEPEEASTEKAPEESAAN